MIRVLVVDDSAVMRAVLRHHMASASDIEVIGEAADAYEAREQILHLAPDVVTLDIEMPRMDGLSFLSRLMRYHPLPVVVVSSLAPSNSDAALRALALGAVEVISKPELSQPISSLAAPLVRAVRAAAAAKVSAARETTETDTATAAMPISSAVPASARTARVIVMGASTGGPAAIERVLAAIPPGTPPIVIVQHMPAGFTSAFARRLNERCALRVKEAEDGEPLQAGTALIAPGGRHTVVLRGDEGLRIGVRDGPPVHYQRPAVDVLFHSVAQAVGAGAVGVLLTGMGADGASGMRTMRDAGAHTIAQDEASSIVFSMPSEAIRLEGVSEVVALPRIAAAVVKAVVGRHAATMKANA